MKHSTLIAVFVAFLSPNLCGQSDLPPYLISTIAGVYPLGDNGLATSALLDTPSDVALDNKGNLYIADRRHHRIRKVTPGGIINTFAGAGFPGFGGDGGAATSALLDSPFGVGVDSAGNVYIADTGNNRVRKVTPDGRINTIAGTGAAGFAGDGGPATLALLNAPYDVTTDAAGNLYFADTDNHRVRKVTSDGQISTVMGTRTAGFNGDGQAGIATQLNSPRGVSVDAVGNLYIADSNNLRVRKLSAGGIVSTVAGNGAAGRTGDGGPATLAPLDAPQKLAVDGAGNIYVATTSSIRKVTASGVISTLVGAAAGGFAGDGGLSTAARVDEPIGVEVDSGGSLYVADSLNHRIRRVDGNGYINTVAGASHFSGDGGAATAARLFSPKGLAVDAAGNLFIADEQNNRIRKITVAGVISTVAGSGARGNAGDNGPATSAALDFPDGLAVDMAGNLFIADKFSNRIRKIDSSGTMTLFAGSGTGGFSGDNGAATSTQLNQPRGVLVDRLGSVYIGDTANQRVRKVSPSNVITTVAGTGTAGFSGDNGPGNLAQLNGPRELALDRTATLYVSDRDNHRIRAINASGNISTFAGTGESGFGGDGGPAVLARLSQPGGVAVDAAGNVYLADTANQRIRVVTPAGMTSTIAGTGARGFSGDGGLATQARLNDPEALVVSSDGSIYVSDSSNHRIRKLTPLIPTGLIAESGNNQSGVVNTYIANPLTIQVNSAAGAGVPGVTVTFAVTQGDATLSSSTVVTAANGTVTVDVKLGSTPGPVTITATASGLAPQLFHLTATAAPPGAGLSPHIVAGGVVGGGLSIPSVKQISANAIISIFGADFAPAGTARLVGGDDLVDGRLPTKLGGVCVQVGSGPAPIFHVFPGQLNIQVPSLTMSGDVRLQVRVNCEASNEVRSNIVTVTLQPATPEFFYFASNPDGRNPVAATNAATGDYIGAPGLLPGASFTPAKPGDIVTLYATGFGATSPSFAAGDLPGSAGAVTAPLTVNLGGVALSPEDILYAGVSSFAGLYQLNIRIPDEVPDGDQPITVAIGEFSTPPAGYLTVAR